MDRMKQASSFKQVTYRFGYSNLTLDLWIILHMADCNGCMYQRDHYITFVNLQLSNVIDAVNMLKELCKGMKKADIPYINIKDKNTTRKTHHLQSGRLLKRYLRIVGSWTILGMELSSLKKV